MKLFALIYLVLATPVAVFLYTIFYGGINNTVLKNELARSKTYSAIADFAATIKPEDSDTSEDEILSVIKEHVTQSYVKEKTEELIDVSYNWVTGTTNTPPVISFKDIKDEIMAKNPELLSSLEDISKEAQAAGPSSDLSGDEQAQMKQATQGISDLVKSDFTFSLEKQLSAVKSAYATLRILFFATLILLAVSILIIVLRANDLKSKMRWLAAAFAVAGVWGFIIIALNVGITNVLTQLTTSTSNEAANIALPIVVAVVGKFVSTFTTNQGILSIALILFGAVFLAIPELTKNKDVTVAPIKQGKKK